MSFFKDLSIEKVTVRLFSSLLMSNVVFAAATGFTPFSDMKAFVGGVNTITFILFFLIIFATLNVVFYFVKRLDIERMILLGTLILYAGVCVASEKSAYFALGVALVLAAVCVYVFNGKASPRIIKRDIPIGVLIAAGAVAFTYFAVYVGIQTVCKYLTQSTPNFDFGIFAQMFNSMKTDLTQNVTVERDVLLSHMAVHVSPIFYLFLPFYALFPSPATLLVCQALMLASGVGPVIFLARKIGLSKKAAAVFALIYAIYPALAGGCFFDLHENKFLAPLVLWLFYFIEKNKWIGTMTFTVLVLLVKEDAAIYVIFASIFVMLAKESKAKIKGCAMFGTAVTYFFVVSWLMQEFGLGTMTSRFNTYMGDGESGLLYVVINVIKNPAYVLRDIFDNTADKNASLSTKIEFMIHMMLPLGCMPVVTKKLSRLVLILPMILINFMPNWVYHHSIFYQYTYGAMAFLIYASMLNFADLSANAKRVFATLSLCMGLFVSMQTVYQKPNYVQNYIASKEYHDAVREAINEIPEDASVGCTGFLTATASNHKYLYSLDDKSYRTTKDNEEVNCGFDYIVLDLRYSAGKTLDNETYQNNGDYEEIYRLDKWVVIYRRIAEPVPHDILDSIKLK